MKKAARQRKGSMEEDDNIPTSTEGGNNLSGIKGLGEQLQSLTIGMVGRETGNNLSDDDLPSDSDEEEESDSDMDEEAHFQEDANKISAKHIKHTDMDERAKEDMDFPDEVETPLINARERFNKYRGIKSLRNCDWDPYENLPEDYSKVWRFQAYPAAHKDSVQ